MKKHVNKILLGSILFFISLNAFSILPAVWYVAEFVGVAAVQNALQQKTSLLLNHDSLKSKLPANYLGRGGYKMQIPLLLGAGALFSLGNIDSSSEPYASDTVIYDEPLPYYSGDAFISDTAFAVKVTAQVGYDRCYVQSYRTSNGGSFEALQPAYINEGVTLSPIYTTNGSYFDGSVTCSLSSGGLSADFSNPQAVYVPQAQLQDGTFQENGQPVPVVDFPVDDSNELLRDIWDAVSNKPTDYQGLTLEEAKARANHYDGSNKILDDYLNEGLPLKPDYIASEITTAEGAPQYYKTDYYDENGNYSHTVTDTYIPMTRLEDGVPVETYEYYDGRTQSTEASKIGTTGSPNSSSVDSGSTYSGSNASTNSQKSEDTLVNQNTSKAEQALLGSILGEMIGLNNSVKSTNTSIDDLNNVISSEPVQPTDLDLTTTVDDFSNSLGTDEQIQADIPRLEIDFDSFSVTPNVFNTAPCQNIYYDVNGTVHTWNLSIFCEILHLFSLFLLAFAVYDSLPIILRALQA